MQPITIPEAIKLLVYRRAMAEISLPTRKEQAENLLRQLPPEDSLVVQVQRAFLERVQAETELGYAKSIPPVFSYPLFQEWVTENKTINQPLLKSLRYSTANPDELTRESLGRNVADLSGTERRELQAEIRAENLKKEVYQKELMPFLTELAVQNLLNPLMTPGFMKVFEGLQKRKLMLQSIEAQLLPVYVYVKDLMEKPPEYNQYIFMTSETAQASYEINSNKFREQERQRQAAEEEQERQRQAAEQIQRSMATPAPIPNTQVAAVEPGAVVEPPPEVKPNPLLHILPAWATAVLGSELAGNLKKALFKHMPSEKLVADLQAKIQAFAPQGDRQGDREEVRKNALLALPAVLAVCEMTMAKIGHKGGLKLGGGQDLLIKIDQRFRLMDHQNANDKNKDRLQVAASYFSIMHELYSQDGKTDPALLKVLDVINIVTKLAFSKDLQEKLSKEKPKFSSDTIASAERAFSELSEAKSIQDLMTCSGKYERLSKTIHQLVENVCKKAPNIPEIFTDNEGRLCSAVKEQFERDRISIARSYERIQRLNKPKQEEVAASAPGVLMRRRSTQDMQDMQEELQQLQQGLQPSSPTASTQSTSSGSSASSSPAGSPKSSADRKGTSNPKG